MNILRTIRTSELSDEFYKPRALGGSAEAVATIIANVRKWGDDSVTEYSSAFDKTAPDTLEIPTDELKEAGRTLKTEKPALYDALSYSRDLALRFAAKQRESFIDFETEMVAGIIAGQKVIPVNRAGIYIPAGHFPLVSTVIMTMCPAIAAGVRKLALCTPPRKHPNDTGASIHPWADEGILGAAALCADSLSAGSIFRVFAAGGAQAIAAMAYGTKTIPKCDVIVGPGNRYVAEAKRQIFGQAGIDMIAGPSEVFIIADSSANPEWVAADLIAQAEHDADAEAVLVTDSVELSDAVKIALEKQTRHLPPLGSARESLAQHGVIILVPEIRAALEIANRKAPEHLELALDAGSDRDFFVQNLCNYGSLFIGHLSAEVLGDYSAGINHTLPTSGSARFTGGLSVRTFLKTVTTLQTLNADSAAKTFTAAEIIAGAEGLAGHAAAAAIRFTTPDAEANDPPDEKANAST